jgi:hypothetical protein
MIQSSMGGSNTRLPKWANGLIVVGSLAIVGLVGYYLYKKLNENKEEKDSKDGVNANDNELKDAIKNGTTLSFPQSNYVYSANAIFNLLDGCETASSERNAILEVIKVTRNKADWMNLVKAFGTKKVDNCGYLTGDTTYNLPELLKDQLDSITGYYYINEPNYKKSGVTAEPLIQILRDYLRTIGVTL